ncbi:Calcium-transporting ATPase 10, plasma membrane-type [Vitis vinifera]|uniref:Calcium-transporting ATPase 10, plasma membrane-type n=1 Tax=Vitis vinifera TaxID=29760 RepID=A0A438DQ84_VITVI|nr:Calcium-transporting ATPase 10, plasma membrane-type [Vitis vinifera]
MARKSDERVDCDGDDDGSRFKLEFSSYPPLPENMTGFGSGLERGKIHTAVLKNPMELHLLGLILAMEPHEEPSSSPVFRMRQSLLRRSASSAHQSQLAIDPKQSYSDNGVPSPTTVHCCSLKNPMELHLLLHPAHQSQLAIDPKQSYSDNGVPSPTTVPLLQSEEPNGASSAGSHLAMEPHEEPSSSPVFRMRQSLLRRSASSAHQSQLAIDPKKSYTADEAPSPSATMPLLPSDSAQPYLAIDVQSDNAEELQKKIARIFEENDLDSLQKIGGAEKLALAFGSNLESGKNPESGESIVTYKKQVLAKDFPGFFVRACNSYTILLLIISACFSLVFEMIEKGPKNGWRDGTAIFLAVLLIVTVDSVSSFREARKQGKNTERGIKVTVIRRGQSVAIYGIVKGDLVCLEKDQTVPADGSMVVGGHGRMLVTSVGSKVVSFKEPLLEARISKPNTCAEFFSLCMASLIVLVLFLRFLHKKHDYHDGGSSNIKGEITVQGVLKIFERMLLKPRGTISILTSFLAAVVIGIQHGMPFVISISLAYWNEKTATDDLVPQNLSACGTMAL